MIFMAKGYDAKAVEDKLRKFWFKIKSKFKKGKSGPSRPRGPPGFPPGPSSAIPRGQTQRRVFPQGRPARGPTPAHRPKGELDNVLKKLKEMGK